MPSRLKGAALRPRGVARWRSVAATWMIALLMVAACLPADGDRPPAAAESAAEEATGTPDPNQVAGAGNAAIEVGAAGAGGGQAQGAVASAAGTANGEDAPAPECVPPEGALAADASLEGRVGDYRLTIVEEVDGTPTRTVQGSLVLLAQVEFFRQFEGSAGGSIPGVTSPLFGSTDVNVEAVGAVRVGSLSSQDPASPGVLVIESETGASPSILLRLGSDANRRDLVRFDGGYTVLTVVEITAESFSGTWSSGARGPDSEGFFCATQSR